MAWSDCIQVGVFGLVTLISTKGGVGKTVSALSGIGNTLLVDGDATRSATLWWKPGCLPFKVVPERQLSKEFTDSKYDFVVFDTEANPTDADLRELAAGSDLTIIPLFLTRSAFMQFSRLPKNLS